eukprot:1730237-Rhodomonas_salina.1
MHCKHPGMSKERLFAWDPTVQMTPVLIPIVLSNKGEERSKRTQASLCLLRDFRQKHVKCQA